MQKPRTSASTETVSVQTAYSPQGSDKLKSGSLPSKPIILSSERLDSDSLGLFRKELEDQIMLAMKHILVVNDAYGGGGRSVIREAVMTDCNRLKRHMLARFDVLCYTSGSISA